MRRGGMLVAVIGLVSMFAAVTILAQGEEGKKDRQAGGGRGDFRGRGGMGGAWMFDGMIMRLLSDSEASKELGITEDQIKTIKEAYEAAKTQNDDSQKKLSELEQELQKLLESDSPDEAAILAAAEKLSAARLDTEKARIKRLVLVKKTLTADQNAKIREKMQQRAKSRDGGQEKEKRGGGDKEKSRPGADAVKPAESTDR